MSGYEYRVRWQRLGLAPRRTTFQTREAAMRHALIVQGRMAEAFPDEDPESCECGDGGPVGQDGCSGTRTKAEKWAERTAGVPPLVGEVVIARRPVGEWEEHLVYVTDEPREWPEPELVNAGDVPEDDIPF